MEILVVDDEFQLADAIVEILKREKIEATAVYDGEDAVRLLNQKFFDAVVLDVMLPGLSGYDVLRIIREKEQYTPVLMLSARGDTTDKVHGLNLGADDYLAKPFDSRELVARINAITRRSEPVRETLLKVGDITLDKSTYTLSSNGNDVVLGVKEFNIMEYLMQNVGKIIPKEQIIEKIWGKGYEAEYNTIEVYASFLRRKLNSVGSKVQIKSHRGVGYKLEESND